MSADPLGDHYRQKQLLDAIEDRMRKVLREASHPCFKLGHAWLTHHPVESGKWYRSADDLPPGDYRYCQRCAKQEAL